MWIGVTTKKNQENYHLRSLSHWIYWSHAKIKMECSICLFYVRGCARNLHVSEMGNANNIKGGWECIVGHFLLMHWCSGAFHERRQQGSSSIGLYRNTAWFNVVNSLYLRLKGVLQRFFLWRKCPSEMAYHRAKIWEKFSGVRKFFFYTAWLAFLCALQWIFDTALSAAPQIPDSTVSVSEDAGVEPRTLATFA